MKWAFTLFICLLIYSCDSAKEPIRVQFNNDFEIIVIDSCEYFYSHRSGHAPPVIVHKENCKNHK